MDQERILSKIDELDNYLEELKNIKPNEFEEYENSIEKKRACERLLHLSIENALDICNLLVSEFRVGIPSDEDDIFTKLEQKKIISKEMKNILIQMKGLRNRLVHRYGEIDNEKIFDIISNNLDDFEKFKEEIIKKINKK
ncbi:DUF86 domain-containing protein [Candidatus Pacearchaeota archaeon]|nr:DUF86 domain-containing protein [Candidatus Pacearchaeota archaeon]